MNILLDGCMVDGYVVTLGPLADALQVCRSWSKAVKAPARLALHMRRLKELSYMRRCRDKWERNGDEWDGMPPSSTEVDGARKRWREEDRERDEALAPFSSHRQEGDRGLSTKRRRL
eukprot:6318359-Prymnesium_polylepis.1